MVKIRSWLKAFRLRTLPLSLSGIIVGSFLALLNGHWDTLIFCLAIATTLFLQVLSNLANDLGDSLKGADNDQRVGPTRSVQSGEITISQMKIAVFICSLLSFATAAPLIYFGVKGMDNSILYIYIGLAIFCVIAAITYTMGKKAYGYLGLGDIFVFLFFGLVSVLGVFTLYTNSFQLLNIFMAISIGLLSAAVLNLNNMRDQVNDKAVGKSTLVVKIGFTQAKRYHFALVIISFLSILSYIILSKEYWLLISLLPFIILFKHLNFVKNTEIPKNLDSQLKVVALTTFLISLLFSLGVWISL